MFHVHSITPTGVTSMGYNDTAVIWAHAQSLMGHHVVNDDGLYLEQPLPSPATWATWVTKPKLDPSDAPLSIYDQAKDNRTWWDRFKAAWIDPVAHAHNEGEPCNNRCFHKAQGR